MYDFFPPWIRCICLALLTCSQAISQSPSIQVSHIIAPVNQLSVGDIDFRNATTPKWLFTVNISITGVPSSLWVRMHVDAGFSLPGGEGYPNTVSFTTDSFLVNGTRAVSNLDLDRTIRLTEYAVNSTARRRLEESALPSGQIPAGTYTFNITITPLDPDIPPVYAPPMVIVLSNPTAVELISPMDGDQFVNQFPLFQWQYDGPSSRISVFEKLPGQASLEEAASGVPQYTATTTAQSLQYPSSGTRVLEPGKTYVWFVEGLAGASGGTTVSRKSALRSFTVGSGGGAQSLSSLLDELARALPQYQALFDDLKAQGFTSAGTIRLNGATISVAELRRVLNNLRLHPDAVSSVESE